MAQRTRGPRAELIRQGIELLLQEGESATDPLELLVGAAGPAGRSDVAVRHDELLYAAKPSS